MKTTMKTASAALMVAGALLTAGCTNTTESTVAQSAWDSMSADEHTEICTGWRMFPDLMDSSISLAESESDPDRDVGFTWDELKPIVEEECG